jgi:hypothetical protein
MLPRESRAKPRPQRLPFLQISASCFDLIDPSLDLVSPETVCGRVVIVEAADHLVSQLPALLRIEPQGFFEDSGGVGHVKSVPSGEARGKQDHRGSRPAMAAETLPHTIKEREGAKAARWTPHRMCSAQPRCVAHALNGRVHG